MRVVREGPIKITRATVEAAWRRRSREQRHVLGDAVCRGLALVVNASSMTWVFSYKPRGQDPRTGKRFSSRSVTIGTPESHSPDDARAIAGQLKGQAKSGKDPAEARKAAIAVSAKARAETVSLLIERYAVALPKRPKMRGSGNLTKRQADAEINHLKRAVAEIGAGAKPASVISGEDVRSAISACGSKAATARHWYGTLNRFFDWALDEGLVTANPCLLVAKGRRPRAVAPRQQFLVPAELALLWKAAAQLNPVHCDLVRFLIAVPCRRGEAANMDWAHLNLSEAVWSQPSHLTKNRDAHRIYLPELAFGTLQARYMAAGRPSSGLVFPAPRLGKPVDTFSDIKQQLVSAVKGLPDWRFHDMRRSFATALGEAGTSEAVADAILNHRQSATRGGVLGVYQMAQRWPERVEAMKLWNNILLRAINSAPPR